MEPFFAPRWTWRSVLLAVCVTLGLYVLLPCLERLSSTPRKMAQARTVGTVQLPPPPPRPHPEISGSEPAAKSNLPKPRMQELRRTLTPLPAALDLKMALGNIGGDFSMDFDVSASSLSEQIQELIFELGDLDEPPQLLARLKPPYPPQARMRGIEGAVVVEFVVTEDGVTRDIRVLSAEPGDVFTQTAVRAIKAWRFVPGKRGGSAVATRVRQRVTFTLK